VNYLAYKNALKQAWKDGKMSADESAMLDTLRKSLNISAEEHINIEKEVRGELAEILNENPDSETQMNSDGVQSNNIGSPTPDTGGAANNFEGNEIKNLLTAGKNAYHKGNYEEAIEYCDKVLLLDPENSEALFFRKRTLSKIEKIRSKGGADKKKKEPELTPEEPPVVEEMVQPEIPVENGIEPSAQNPQPIEEVASAPTPEPVNETTNGGGDPNCKSCGGSGSCHWCEGTGKCYWCKGSGKCDKCKGEGQLNGETCKSCKGSGKCHSCNGDTTCYWCKGSGKCSKCSL
jgi:hypothetical protein